MSTWYENHVQESDRFNKILAQRSILAGAAAAVWWASWTPVRSMGFDAGEWVRFHGTNLLDGFAFHSVTSLGAWLTLSMIATMHSGDTKNAGNTLPSLIGLGLVMYVGLDAELDQAALPGRTFDYTDMECYAAGAGASALISGAIHARAK